jgi:hypothetical protein
MTKKQKMMCTIEKVAEDNKHKLHPIWTKGRWGFHTNCRKCGAFVAITVSTGQIREGELLQEKCKG